VGISEKLFREIAKLVLVLAVDGLVYTSLHEQKADTHCLCEVIPIGGAAGNATELA
jgi:hypothetical protein